MYDASGRRVRTLVRGAQAPDAYEFMWDGLTEAGAPAASGVYFYPLEAGTFRQVKKMVLLK